MGQPRGKARPKRTGECLGADDGPPAPSRSWQAPPDGLFDVIVPTLTAKQFVVVQLVCKDWSRSARYCLKDATPKRPDVDLSKLATLYPNLTQLNLSHVEGLTTRMLTPLRQLTALRELCLSNIALKHQHKDTTNAVAAEAGAQDVAAAATGAAAGEAGVAGTVPATTKAAGRHRGPHLPPQPRTRSRARAAAAHGGIGSRAVGCNKAASPPSSRSPGANQPQQQHGRPAAAGGNTSDEDDPRDSPSVCDSPPPLQQQQQQQRRDAPPHAAADAPGTACAAAATAEGECAAAAAGGGGAAGSGAAGTSATPASPGSSPPLSPASRIFGGLGDVLLRLSKLQADLCPALTADAIASLPNLTDLTLDTLVAPETLAPLARLRCLAVKKLANPEALERLSGLTALLVNSDSSCASDFLPKCTRLPELRSLTFKTSSTKVLQQPDLLCWHGFSRLSSLDLRAPAECLKPGLPALSELGGLRSLSLDLYCASDEELMVTVVAPPNLQSLFVSSDRSRSGGVIDVHPNPRLRSLRIRLYWTALNLVLPEGVPEPSPLPEPLSEDLEEAAGPSSHPNPDRTQMPGPNPAAGDAGAAGGARAARGGAAGELAPADRANADVATEDRQEGCTAAAAAAVAAPESGGARPSGRGLRRRRGSDGSPSPAGGGGAVDSPERGPRRRVMEAGAGGSGGAAAAAAGDPSTGGRGTPAVATAPGDSSNDNSGRPSGGSNGGSSGEEVGFGGAGPSAAGGGLAAAGSGGRSAGAGAEEVTDAAGGEPHANRREGTPRAHCRGGGSGGGTATPAASIGGATAAASNVPVMELQELCLDACFFLLYGSLVPLLRQFPGLRRLTLDNCLALENGELAQLCELSGLRELSLSGLHLVTDAGLRSLGRLPALASLRIKGLRKLSVHAAQAYMRQKPIVRRYEEISGAFLTSLSGLADLRSLALKHLHTAGEGPLAAGLGALSQLTRLEVKDVHSMSDKVLLALTGHKALQDLSVLHCEGVTSRGRNAVVRSLGQRVALDFEGCSLPDITRPCALPTTSTQAQLIDDDQVSSSNQPPRSFQHSNQH
ncbi:hypothetical protein PLESTB_001163500 [Pleodorina starrii]|uniref:F-box domain-containing protein n=1 Tax=Pleodorina starrii TaxID=330485 RepID=A0A9W6BR56_9CHLO|nr:hypothetical protein PLESTB_001163500 [Pleodorina starrii]